MLKKPGHIFRDPGAPIVEADFRPIAVQRDPEEILALIFARLGRDYGGPLVDPSPVVGAAARAPMPPRQNC
ncbi:hypothetical protein ABIF68_007124 [Bradyrhizobium japonicum]|jgi:hypothetical protein|uniref:hypothetical protein n=1 Tax=Bradyrhizobium TaxID=374 RepID=UPI0005763E76|nr:MULTISPECIES: hypothetical protein [Bradyrhizobium]MBR0948536.1 hypothetical protein [Bradyrhizobium liaoningense]MDI2071063.1 hypothetical protein [Bradyrhizobium sp. Mp27]